MRRLPLRTATTVAGLSCLVLATSGCGSQASPGSIPEPTEEQLKTSSFESEFDDRADAAAASDRAATRCGAILLQELAPGALPDYERTFDTIGTGGSVQAASDARLAVMEKELDVRMRRIIRNR